MPIVPSFELTEFDVETLRQEMADRIDILRSFTKMRLVTNAEVRDYQHRISILLFVLTKLESV